MIPKFAYERPASLQQALKHLAGNGARIHAGGTDLLGCLRDGITAADRIVSISSLEELRGISRMKDGGIRIGSLTTLAETARHPIVAAEYPALAQGAASAASPQLRNQGTLGGNLCQRPRCWYFRGEFHCLRKGGSICYAVNGRNEFHCILGGDSCFIVHPSDTAPALVALDARIRIAGSRGMRTIPIASFFVGPDKDHTRENVLTPGEILTDVLLPPPASGQRSSYRKVRARGAWDFSLAGVAVTIRMKEARVESIRIVLSGVAPVPWRSVKAEQALLGKPLIDETVSLAAEESVREAIPLAFNEYKVHLVKGIVREALLNLRHVNM
jgi:xanthine dehydrogenase YagS FAD-binding subunit